MKFRYDGPFDEVEVPVLGATVKHGHQVEASGALAESLDSQADWTRVDKPDPRPAAQKAAAKTAESSAPNPAPVVDKTEE